MNSFWADGTVAEARVDAKRGDHFLQADLRGVISPTPFRAKRLRVPADLPALRDRATLERALASFGTNLVREVSDPAVIAVFRLATFSD